MFTFYTPWKHQNTKVSWCFQVVKNGNIGQKWVKHEHVIVNCDAFYIITCGHCYINRIMIRTCSRTRPWIYQRSSNESAMNIPEGLFPWSDCPFLIFSFFFSFFYFWESSFLFFLEICHFFRFSFLFLSKALCVITETMWH